MGNTNFSLDYFDFLKVGFWMSIFLVLIKYICKVNISLFMALLPLVICLGVLFIAIFIIGLITIIFIIKESSDQEEDDNQEDNIQDGDVV